MIKGTIEVDLGYLYADVNHGGPFRLLEKESVVTTPFLEILDEVRELHNKKQADYGRTGDPFANVRASADFGVPAWVGCMIRANDKMRRIQSFAVKGSLENESLEDSLLDLAVYSIIALVLRREQVQQGEVASDPPPPALTASPELVERKPVIEWGGDGYIQWAGVASRLESGEIDEFHCYKKSTSAAQLKMMLFIKYPLLCCSVVPFESVALAERCEIVLVLWSKILSA